MNSDTLVNRREAICAVSAAGAFLVAPGGLRARSKPSGDNDRGSAFLHKPQVAHFNAAHLCPMPRSVSDALVRADWLIDSDPSQANEDHFERERERLRVRLQHALTAASPGEFALVRNATEANNAIVNGYPFEPGDEIVLWDENHPSNNVAWDVRAKRDRLLVHRVTLPAQRDSSENILEAFAAKFTSRTRLLAITHVSNVSGFRLPVEKLCAYARQHDIFVHVDGAQTWGAMPIDLTAMGCNSFCGSAHKWLMGPREIGLLFVRSEDVARLWPSVVGLSWGDGWETARKEARKFDCFGQRNDAAIAAMHAALDFHEDIGIRKIEEHNRHIVEAIGQHCQHLGLRLVSPHNSSFSSSIVVVDAPISRRTQLVETFYAKYRITASTRGGIRLSPHIYNDDNDLDRVVSALDRMSADIRSIS